MRFNTLGHNTSMRFGIALVLLYVSLYHKKKINCYIGFIKMTLLHMIPYLPSLLSFGIVRFCDSWCYRCLSASSLLRVMICRLLCAKPLPGQNSNQISVGSKANLGENMNNLFQENQLENVVYKMKAVLFNSHCAAADIYQWPLLLTWFNFNPSMDK